MKEITEDYVSFEVAKLLKEKGFDELTCGFYHNDYMETLIVSSPSKHNGSINAFAAPSQAQIMKWLREKHKLFIDITAAMEDYIEDGVVKYKDPYYTWEVFSLEIGETLCFGESQNVKESYEDACESAIKYCLENLI